MAAQGWGRIVNISGLNARRTGSIPSTIRTVAVSWRPSALPCSYVVVFVCSLRAVAVTGANRGVVHYQRAFPAPRR